MKVEFAVAGLPPKKDGANSMWRKGVELARLKALRHAALHALEGQQLFTSNVQLHVDVYSLLKSGDLDNFIAGICDGLMAAHPRTPIDDQQWLDVPPLAHPRFPIAFADDAIVRRIDAQRKRLARSDPHYEITIIGE
jgi:hypothetical protein